MDLISVIMPVYNSKKYLDLSINSVLNQTYSNFELILVDDGSSDGSSEICDLFAKKDSRIKVIHKVNEGVCKTRNVGIQNSLGKYIAFIDNDDEYDKNFLKLLYENIKKDNSDIVKCGRKNIKVNENQKNISEKVCKYDYSKLSIKEFINNYYYIRKSEILSSIWNGLYSKELIIKKNILFDIQLRHGNEDIIFNSNYFKNCNNITIIPDVLYTHYYRMSHSTSMKFYADQVSSRIQAINSELEILECANNKIQCDMIKIEGIRESFKILSQAKSIDDKKIGIQEIQNKFKYDNILKKTKILFNTKLNLKQKIDILLIKYNFINVYFGLQNIKRKIF